VTQGSKTASPQRKPWAEQAQAIGLERSGWCCPDLGSRAL